jgi:hypothetical protein
MTPEEWRREVVTEIAWISQARLPKDSTWVRIRFAFMHSLHYPEDSQQVVTVDIFYADKMSTTHRGYWWQHDGVHEGVRKMAFLWGVEAGTVTLKTFVLRAGDWSHDS